MQDLFFMVPRMHWKGFSQTINGAGVGAGRMSKTTTCCFHYRCQSQYGHGCYAPLMAATGGRVGLCWPDWEPRFKVSESNPHYEVPRCIDMPRSAAPKERCNSYQLARHGVGEADLPPPPDPHGEHCRSPFLQVPDACNAPMVRCAHWENSFVDRRVHRGVMRYLGSSCVAPPNAPPRQQSSVVAVSEGEPRNRHRSSSARSTLNNQSSALSWLDQVV